jgi:ankyrin repeat protein
MENSIFSLSRMRTLFRASVACLMLVAGTAAAADLQLLDAAQKGDKGAVQSLLKGKPDVNARQADGATALSWAAYHDDLGMAELLLSAGANVNAANDYGVTPLTLACNNGSAPMVERLLKSGARVSDPEFMSCVRTGNLAAVKALLGHGANVDAKEGREGQTVLMWASAEQHPDIVQTLIQHGADVQAHSAGGFTALMFAAQRENLDTVKALVAAGANVNAATPSGETPLLIAAESGREAIGIYLVDHEANPNVAEENGLTPLHFCFMKGLARLHRIRIPSYALYLVREDMLDLTKSLLVHGADPNAKVKKWSDKLIGVTKTAVIPGSVSPYGATPFMLAATSWDAEGMRMLAAAGANPTKKTEMQSGVVIGKDGLIEPSAAGKLIAAGVIEPNEVGPWEVTPLMMAVGIWRTRGAYPLFEEEEKKALEAAKVAIELGNDVNAKDTLGLTALHGAAFFGSNLLIQYLVEKGADLNAKDMSGQTPLHKALNIKPTGTYDNNGKFTPTPVHRALIPEWVPPETADLLLKLGATPVERATPLSEAAAKASSDQAPK